jgi:receptor protein-tyrosine kinase
MRRDPTMAARPFFSILRDRWRAAASVVALAATGAGAILLVPPRYGATAQVLVEPSTSASAADRAAAAGPARGSGHHLATQVDILTSQRVALSVVDRLGLAEDARAVADWRVRSGGVGSLRHDLSDRLQRGLRVRLSPDSDLIDVAYVDRDPVVAARTATAFAQAYVDLVAQLPVGRTAAVVLAPAGEPARPSGPRPSWFAALALLLGIPLAAAAALVAERRDRRVRSADDLTRATGAAPIATLRDAASAHAAVRPAHGGGGTEEAGDFAATRPLPAAGADGPPQPIGQILVRAGALHPPEVERILHWARTEGRRFGEAAVAHGAVTERQLERALALQFDYPVLAPGESGVSAEVVAASDAGGRVAADLRRLRERIRAQQAATVGHPLRALAVISAGRGEGKTFTAANLAVVFAQAGQRTLLVDADLRRGRVHRLFGLPNRAGLSTLLNGQVGPGLLHRVPGLGGLTVLACGPTPPNPSELLARPAFGQALEAFCSRFDVVLLDTAGAAEEPDAALVAGRAGAALVVARRGHSTFDAVVRLVSSGAVPPSTVLGTVLNDA